MTGVIYIKWWYISSGYLWHFMELKNNIDDIVHVFVELLYWINIVINFNIKIKGKYCTIRNY